MHYHRAKDSNMVHLWQYSGNSGMATCITNLLMRPIWVGFVHTCSEGVLEVLVKSGMFLKGLSPPPCFLLLTCSRRPCTVVVVGMGLLV